MNYYYLEVIKGDMPGRRYPIPDGAVSIGRSSSNTIVLVSIEKVISSHHAIIYKSPERIMIQDMQSTNGTFVNENRVFEHDLSPDDIVGFGKTGPRLKLLVSQTELPAESGGSSHRAGAPSHESDIHTSDDARQYSASSTNAADTDCTVKCPVDTSGDESDSSYTPSVTLNMEKKLMENQLSINEMHSLMKNDKRFGKILERGNLNEAQSSLLLSAYGANKKSRNRWMMVLGGVSIIFLTVMIILGIRIIYYRQMLNKGLSLEEKLDLYEAKIFKANANPDMNKKELAEMIRELDQTKQQLADVKKNLSNEDYEKFYSDTTEMLIDQVMMRFGESNYHIPEEMVERVKFHISVYSGRMKPKIARYFERKKVYFPMIKKIFEEKNLPLDLAYISMLESGFNPQALSHAGARGLWQFMPATGRTYGLVVDNTIDERCDPEKATYAAAEYFKDLISIFGGKSSVMLAMAAYNAGEGRILGALRKIDDPMRNRDFWYIYRMGCLAEETNEYIPRVLALMIIDTNPAMFGIQANGTADAPDAFDDDSMEPEQ